MENKLTVMIVDDTPDNLRILEEMLTKKGYDVRALPRGAMALKSAFSCPPDIMLLDINMPDMSGYEVCAQLKKNKITKDLPVIFISALNEPEDKLNAFSLGGVDYITKPFQFDEVNARIETHLRIREYQQQLEKHNKNLEKLVAEKVQEISEAQMSTIYALANMAEARDDDIGQHIARVQALCKLLAIQLKNNSIYSDQIGDNFVEALYLASPLHDIGKVSIPDDVLLKPARLTTEEFEVMKTHAEIGAKNLEKVRAKYPQNEFISMGKNIAMTHHEKWNGAGYPIGLQGEDIPLAGRIMAVVDVYDALRSKRVYKEAFSHEKSYNIIVNDAGTHFDPVIVDAFKALEKQFEKIRDEMD